MRELISVIVPVYDVENYLRSCLDSILKQSYENLEIILVDDGSDDGSKEICQEYAKLDDRIKLVWQEHKGVAAARNAGVAASTGKYITFVDSDDFIEANYLQVMYQSLITSGSDIVCGEFLCFVDGREADALAQWKVGASKKVGFRTYQRTEMTEKALYQHISVTASQQKLYKREVFDNLQFPEGRIYEDLATTYQFFLNANHVSVIDNKLYAYRIRNSGIMNEAFSERKLDCVWVSQQLYSDICRREPKLGKAAACACFRVNRLVLYQIPYKEKVKRNMVWCEIKKYRKTVLLDDKAQIYERMLAAVSYVGPVLFSVALNIFQVLRKLKIMLDIRG